MRITITGATGFVGTRLVAALKARGDDVTVLSRNATRAADQLGVEAVAWDWQRGPAPAQALAGRDVVVHLAGEPVSQRWNDAVKERIRDSRERGTSELVAGIASADPRPPRLICASACAYYGAHGTEIVDETSPAAHDDFLADVCVRWERAADGAARARRGRRQGPHRDRAAPRQRRAAEHGAAVQARPRRAARRRAPVPAVDPSRRPARPVRRPRRRRPTSAGRSTARHPTRSPTRSSRRRSGAPCTAPRRCRCRASPPSSSPATSRSTRSPACGWCPGAPASSAMRLRSPTSTARWPTRCGR